MRLTCQFRQFLVGTIERRIWPRSDAADWNPVPTENLLFAAPAVSADSDLLVAVNTDHLAVSAAVFPVSDSASMAKPQHKVKKANHGRRPASAKARKAKRKKVKT